jgi:hypothetical protein
MSQHYYSKTKDGRITLSKSVTSPATARKSKTKVYASVTTKLAYMPSPFMDGWKDREIVRLARENPDLSLEELQDLRWGTRTMPDGSTVSSSEFGTLVHEQLENATLSLIDGADYHNLEWLCYYRPFLSWLSAEQITPTHAEFKVCSDRYNTAGTLDGVGIKDGKVILWDFKCRAGENLKTKAYLKDCCQLAVEADIVRSDWGLDYMPRIHTIIVDADSGAVHDKAWTVAAAEKALAKFDCLSRFVDEFEQLV